MIEIVEIVENDVRRINDLSYIEFSNCFRGYTIVSKKTGAIIPRFLLFWSGITVAEIKNRYSLQRRKNDD